MRKAAIAVAVATLVCAGAFMPARAQTVDAASVLAGQTSLALPAGSSIYIYGMATGGAFPSSNFSQDPYQELLDADGIPVAGLAVTRSNQDSFSTGAAYYVTGGVGVSGFTSMSQSYGASNSPGASSAADTFTVGQSSLVVVVAMAGGQSYATLSGVPGLQVDSQAGSQSGGAVGMVTAHAVLSPGAYTVTENSLPSPAPGQDPDHMGDLVGVFVFSGGSIPPSPPGPMSSTLLLVGGTINGQEVSPSDRTVAVLPGEAITGSLTVSINSYWHPEDAMAMGVTPTWGDPASGFTDLGGFGNPAVGLSRTINLNLTAPTTSGTYYIVAAYNATYTAAQVMSDTNWSAGAAEGLGVGYADWNTGDAVADWSPSTIDAADAAGAVWASCLQSFGPSETPPVEDGPCYTPTTAIQIVVGSGVAPGTFNPPSTGTASTPSVAPLAIEIDNNSPAGGSQGFLVFTCQEIEDLVSSLGTDVPHASGPDDGAGGCTSQYAGVADPTKYTLGQLLLAVSGGDDFVSFQDFAAEVLASDLQESSNAHVAYVVPPGGSLIVLVPNAEVPADGSIRINVSGSLDFWGCVTSGCANDGGEVATAGSFYMNSYDTEDDHSTQCFTISGAVDGAEPYEEAILSVAPTGSTAGPGGGACTTSQNTLSDAGIGEVVGMAGPTLTASAEGTSSSDGGVALATSEGSAGATLTASGLGAGSVGTGIYPTDPSAPSTGSLEASCLVCSTAYFDVSASQPNSLSSLAIDECLAASGSWTPTVSWFDPQVSDLGNLYGLLGSSGYVAIQPSDVDDYEVTADSGGMQCVSFTLNSGTNPSVADLVGTYFRVVAVPPGDGAVHLVTTLQSITFDPSVHQYIATLVIGNAGASTADGATLEAATLNGTGTASAVPIPLGNLAFGSATLAVIEFPASAGPEGGRAALSVGEAYSGGAAGAAFRVTLP